MDIHMSYRYRHTQERMNMVIVAHVLDATDKRSPNRRRCEDPPSTRSLWGKCGRSGEVERAKEDPLRKSRPCSSDITHSQRQTYLSVGPSGHENSGLARKETALLQDSWELHYDCAHGLLNARVRKPGSQNTVRLTMPPQAPFPSSALNSISGHAAARTSDSWYATPSPAPPSSPQTASISPPVPYASL